MDSLKRLRQILIDRANGLNPEIRRRILSSGQVVIFGSYAAGEESELSDLDVFCLGDSRMHYKDRKVEIFVLPEYDIYSDLWLGSELACHISRYGLPLNDKPSWFDLTYISGDAKDRKKNRIQAYLRAVDKYWGALGGINRLRYSTKIRREIQRFSLIKDGFPVPATRILDRCFKSWGAPDMMLLCEDLDINSRIVDMLSNCK